MAPVFQGDLRARNSQDVREAIPCSAWVVRGWDATFLGFRLQHDFTGEGRFMSGLELVTLWQWQFSLCLVSWIRQEVDESRARLHDLDIHC